MIGMVSLSVVVVAAVVFLSFGKLLKECAVAEIEDMQTCLK